MEVVIEVSKNSNLKYEYDLENKKLFLDRVLHNSNFFPYNYGFIPNTLAPDGDPIDIILLSKHSLAPGCHVNVRVIGKIYTSDEKGRDDKIICVLDSKIDKEYEKIVEISELPESELNHIIYFLTHYKDGEKNKFIEIGDVTSREDSIRFINEYSLNNFI